MGLFGDLFNVLIRYILAPQSGNEFVNRQAGADPWRTRFDLLRKDASTSGEKSRSITANLLCGFEGPGRIFPHPEKAGNN